MNTTEKRYVHSTYQIIYKHFDNSRAYLWKSVKEFLDIIPPNSIILEVGSGNGKNLIRRKDCVNIAIDLCSEFCTITQYKNIDSVIANNLMLPIKSNSIDYLLSIAVIHHLSSYSRRMECLKELVRVLCPKGKLLIQVWAFEQSDKSRNKFTQQENLVEFKSPDKTIKELRYYYVFRKNELEEMIMNIDDIKLISSYWECGNWVVILEKNKI